MRKVLDKIARRLGWFFFKYVMGVKVTGLENLPKDGEKYVLIANHQSFLDVPLMMSMMRKPNFIFPADTFIAQKPFLKFIFGLTTTQIFPLNPANPMSLRHLIRFSQDNADSPVVIFPEGRITTTGALMKVYSGAGMVADKTDAKILPVRLEGLQYSKFSRLQHLGIPLKWFPRGVQMHILPMQEIDVPDELVGRARRMAVTQCVSDIMVESHASTTNTDMTLFEKVFSSAHKYGLDREMLSDITRVPMTYKKLLQAAHVVGRRLSKHTKSGEYVGLLLPNANGVAATFLGLSKFGRVPAMLNFSAGEANLKNAIKAANIKTVYTSHAFVVAAKLSETVEALKEVVEVRYMEDVRKSVNIFHKIDAALFALRPLTPQYKPTDPAVVLFTSGSEGAPKGVVLSHKNIMTNYAQLHAKFDFNPADRLLGAMPMFHSFGLMGCFLLPLFLGIRAFLYPSPLHFRAIPELVYDFRATIMFGTDTFLSRYARFAHPYDFFTTRMVFAGAEKLKEETRSKWARDFGVKVIEGYGATETSPALCVNTLMESKPGTVGKLLPMVEHHLHDMEGIEEGGRLHVRAPNVMLGYLRVDNPGVIEPPHTAEEGPGWYDTGDIVKIDDEGFVHILDRAKRFAKVAGEMVPLGTVEKVINEAWKDDHHAILAVEDSLKGEKLVLFTTNDKIDRSALKKELKANKLPDLYLPREVLYISPMPLLGTGKTDYPKLKKQYLEEQKA